MFPVVPVPTFFQQTALFLIEPLQLFQDTLSLLESLLQHGTDGVLDDIFDNIVGSKI